MWAIFMLHFFSAFSPLLFLLVHTQWTWQSSFGKMFFSFVHNVLLDWFFCSFLNIFFSFQQLLFLSGLLDYSVFQYNTYWLQQWKKNLRIFGNFNAFSDELAFHNNFMSVKLWKINWVSYKTNWVPWILYGRMPYLMSFLLPLY